MGEGAKEAFCVLLWAQNGGKVDLKGRPLFGSSGPVRGNCSTPYDCLNCLLMQQELASHPTGYAFWVCPACVSILAKDAKAKGQAFYLSGHYTEGQCQFAGCTRPERIENEEELPPRFSRFLQLIIYEPPKRE